MNSTLPGHFPGFGVLSLSQEFCLTLLPPWFRIVQKSAALPTFNDHFDKDQLTSCHNLGHAQYHHALSMDSMWTHCLWMPMMSQDISHRDSPSAVPPGVSTNVMHLHLSNGMCAYLHGWYLPFQWYPPTVLHRVPYSVFVVVSAY